MSRSLRILFVAATALCIAGASAVYACDSHKKEASASAASVESHKTEASVEGTASGCKSGAVQASTGAGCSAAAKAGCASKTMAAASDCTYCGFVADLKANSGKVTFSVADSKDGVQFVFAAVTKNDVETAQTVAGKAYALMTPAHCEMAKAAMAEKSCNGCQEGLSAFSGTEIQFKNTENGSVATIKTADKKKIEQLHTFAKGLLPVQEATPQG